MTFEEMCEAVRLYVEDTPTEGGRGSRDDFRGRLDETLASIRVELASYHDEVRRMTPDQNHRTASPTPLPEGVEEGRWLAKSLADAARALLARPPEMRGPFGPMDEEKLRAVAALPPRLSTPAPSKADAVPVETQAGWIVRDFMVTRGVNLSGQQSDLRGPWFYPVEREEHAKGAALTLHAECLPVYVKEPVE